MTPSRTDISRCTTTPGSRLSSRRPDLRQNHCWSVTPTSAHRPAPHSVPGPTVPPIGCIIVMSLLIVGMLRGHTSHAEHNKLVRCINGNIQKAITVVFQNIPDFTPIDDIHIDIANLMHAYKYPAVLMIGEADSDKVRMCTPSDYTFVKGKMKDASKIRVSALVSKSVKYREISPDTEVPVVGVQIGSWKLFSIYREWAKEGKQSTRDPKYQLERFETLIEFWKKQKGKAIWLGDYNFDPRANISAHQDSLEKIRLLVSENILHEGWIQMVENPTRAQGRNVPTILDHLYTRHANFIQNVSNEDVVGHDHNSIAVKFNVDREVMVNKIVFFRNIEKVDPLDFEMIFNSANLHELYNEDRDSTRAAVILTNRILWTLNLVAPVQRKVIKENSNPWFQTDLRVYLEDAKAMREVWLESGDEDDRKAWRCWKNWARNKCRNKRKTWEQEKCNDKDPQKMWKAITENSGLNLKNSDAIYLKDQDGKVVTNEYMVAKMLNDGFKGKVDRLSAQLKPDVISMLNHTAEHVSVVEKTYGKWDKFAFRTVGTGEVAKIIRKLKNTGSEGTDGIQTRVLKKFINCLAGPIRHVINLAIKMKTFPDCWKTGIIVPIHKGGDRFDPGQYRPVNILPALSKTLEKVMNFQLNRFFEGTHLFSNSQHAYRQHRSCSSAILDVDTIVNKGRAEGKHVSILSTDMSSAFDLVDKDILTPKMKMFGFADSAVDLIRDYLSNRRALTRVGRATSDTVLLRLGVGQGSCLGPLIFGMLFVDLPIVAIRTQEEIRNSPDPALRCPDATLHTVEFADDGTGVQVNTGELKNELITNLHKDRLYGYYEDAGMKINPKKSNMLVIRPRSSDKNTRKLMLGDQEEVDFLRLLGCWLDSKWSFNVHLKKCREKLNITLAHLGKVHHLVSQKNMNSVSRAYVHQKLGFVGETWLVRKEVLVGAQKLLNNAARLVLMGKIRFKGQQNFHVEEMNKTLSWYNIKNMVRELQIKIFFKMKYLKFVAPITNTEFKKAQLAEEDGEALRHLAPRSCWSRARYKAPVENAAINRIVSTIKECKMFRNYYPERTTREGYQVFDPGELSSEIKKVLSTFENGNVC